MCNFQHKLIEKQLQKYTYAYNSLQFPAEMDPRASKTPFKITFIPLCTEFDYRERVLIHFVTW